MKYFATLLLVGPLIAACGKTEGGKDASAKAHEDSIRANVQAVYDIISSGDLNGLDKYIAPNAIDHQMMPGYPGGLQGTKQMIADWRKGFSNMKFTIDKLIVSGNDVAVLYTWNAVNSGDYMGMKATNIPVNVQGSDWMHLENGKVTEHWGFGEDVKLMQELRIMPASPQVPPPPPKRK